MRAVYAVAVLTFGVGFVLFPIALAITVVAFRRTAHAVRSSGSEPLPPAPLRRLVFSPLAFFCFFSSAVNCDLALAVVRAVRPVPPRCPGQ